MDRPACYPQLAQLKLSELQLRSFHFPRPVSLIRGKAQIFNIDSSHYRIQPCNPNKRNCKRCLKQYAIRADGFPMKREQCHYHPNKMSRGLLPKYYCCDRGLYDDPCKCAPQHVTDDVDPDNLTGFITTKNNHLVNVDNVYAMDCEMICTTAGLELACISVVDDRSKLVYETMVLPDNPVTDYLTEHSSLTERDFRKVSTRLEDVQAKLLGLFGDRTIVVGHSLNNDLLRVKLLHDHIVDTAVIYPHPKGGKFRNSLRYLKEMYLPQERVESSVPKCRSDAQASMKLALLKCRTRH